MINTRAKGLVIQRNPTKHNKLCSSSLIPSFTENDFPPLIATNILSSKPLRSKNNDNKQNQGECLNNLIIDLSANDDNEDKEDFDSPICSSDEDDEHFDISSFEPEQTTEEENFFQVCERLSENFEEYRLLLKQIPKISRKSISISPRTLEIFADFIGNIPSFIKKLKYPKTNCYTLHDSKYSLTRLASNLQKSLPVSDRTIVKLDTEDTAALIVNGRSHEDRCVVTTINDMKYYAVFDGHGKKRYLPDKILERHVVSFIESNLHNWLAMSLNNIDPDDEKSMSQAITKTCVDIDKFLYDHDYTFGSTANIVLITSSKIYQINIGDSRSLIFSGLDIVCETIDCKPEQEKERIEAVGGWITNVFCPRVNDIYATSRSFGDFCCKMVNDVYSPEGPMSVIPIISITPRSPGQYILMGSDGLFDGFKDSSALVKLINKSLDHGLTSASLKEACIDCLEQANSCTNDDMTIVLIRT